MIILISLWKFASYKYVFFESKFGSVKDILGNLKKLFQNLLLYFHSFILTVHFFTIYSSEKFLETAVSLWLECISESILKGFMKGTNIIIISKNWCLISQIHKTLISSLYFIAEVWRVINTENFILVYSGYYLHPFANSAYDIKVY